MRWRPIFMASRVSAGSVFGFQQLCKAVVCNGEVDADVESKPTLCEANRDVERPSCLAGKPSETDIRY